MSSKLRLDREGLTWFSDPSCTAVMDAISPGESDQARFVGGCVRNAIMGHPVDDIDIATKLTPNDVVAKLESARIKFVPTGLEHGTITAVVNKRAFEITTLRKDIETDGRKAVVRFSSDWVEDAQRRDFRLNAIYARRDGSLFDPVSGIEDAQSGRIIFIGDARVRIKEDHLRILRFYRFNAWYGQSLDPDGHQACIALKDTLSAISVERIWKEIKKLLLAEDPTRVVKAMQEGHVVAKVLRDDLDIKLFASIIKGDRGNSRTPDSILRLCGLLGRDWDTMRDVLDDMKASNAERTYGLAMTQALTGLMDADVRPGMGEVARGRAAYRLGADVLAARLRLDEASGYGDADRDLDYLSKFERPRLPIKGKTLLGLGIPAGPKIGEVLDVLEEAWIDSQFSLDHDALLAKAKGMLS